MQNLTDHTPKYGKIAPILLSYIVMGFVDIVGVSTGFAQKDFNLTPTMAQLIPSMVFVWFFVLSIPVSLLQNKIGKKNVLLIGMGATALGMFTPFVSYTFPVFLLSFVLLGIGNTFIQVSSNPLLREVVSEGKYPSLLSISQFVKAISSLLGPLIVAFMVSYTGGWKNVFLAYGLISVATAAWLSKTAIQEKYKADSTSFKECFALLGDPLIACMVFTIFLIVGIDVGMNTNIQGLLGSKFGLSLEDSSLGISLYFFSLMVSRFLGAMMLSKMSHLKFLKWSSLLTVLFFVGLLFSSSLTTTLISIVLIGLASANLFPLIFALTINKRPERSNEISGLMTMAIIGGAVIPLIMGVVQKNFSVIEGFIVLALSALLISFSYKVLANQSK
ncbi:MFS transporter [Algoriphagus aquimarinus]|uniref:MFS transporter n=1 Tax=Algoriphagus aquimarinus TaxID=237018 RepID=UPI0030DAF506|tara:strand:+ start:82480 stop:83643 length:1164 start_codon:yes stop_codon:yes gene_type:complete